MENRKNTGLKKRKLLNDGTVREQEPAIKEMCQALKEMESELQNLRDENNRLRDELLGKDRQLAETRTLLVEREHQLSKTQTLLVDREQQLEARTLLVDTKEFETEILRLKRLLAEKNDTNNYTALVSPETITEVIQKQTPVSPARTPVSNRTNTVQSSVNAIVHHGSFQDEAREPDCCRRGIRTSGNGADVSSRSCVYHMMAESLVGMKFSLKNEIEGFSLSIYHEATGYNFTLTWLEQPDGGEWAYKYSSLGTLEGVAKDWMKLPEIRFSMTMCPVFFERIWSVIRKGR